MQLDGFGEAERFTCEPLDASAQRQMLALNLLGVVFTHFMLGGCPVALVPTPTVGKEAPHVKGLE